MIWSAARIEAIAVPATLLVALLLIVAWSLPGTLIATFVRGWTWHGLFLWYVGSKSP